MALLPAARASPTRRSFYHLWFSVGRRAICLGFLAGMVLGDPLVPAESESRPLLEEGISRDGYAWEISGTARRSGAEGYDLVEMCLGGKGFADEEIGITWVSCRAVERCRRQTGYHDRIPRCLIFFRFGGRAAKCRWKLIRPVGASAENPLAQSPWEGRRSGYEGMRRKVGSRTERTREAAQRRDWKDRAMGVTNSETAGAVPAADTQGCCFGANFSGNTA